MLLWTFKFLKVTKSTVLTVKASVMKLYKKEKKNLPAALYINYIILEDLIFRGSLITVCSSFIFFYRNSFIVSEFIYKAQNRLS